MADFDLVADIRGNFQNIKKSAKREKLEFAVEGQSTVGTAGRKGATGATGKGGLGGMVRLLGGILAAVGVVSAMLEPLKPLLEMVGGILRILAMFLLPLVLLLMPFLAQIMKFLAEDLSKFLDLDLQDKISQLVQELINNFISLINPILKAIPGLDPINRKQAEKEDSSILERIGKRQRELPEKVLSPEFWLKGLPGYGDTWGKGSNNQTIINVQGITDDSTVNKLSYINNTMQEDTIG